MDVAKQQHRPRSLWRRSLSLPPPCAAGQSFIKWQHMVPRRIGAATQLARRSTKWSGRKRIRKPLCGKSCPLHIVTHEGNIREMCRWAASKLVHPDTLPPPSPANRAAGLWLVAAAAAAVALSEWLLTAPTGVMYLCICRRTSVYSDRPAIADTASYCPLPRPPPPPCRRRRWRRSPGTEGPRQQRSSPPPSEKREGHSPGQRRALRARTA